jgi:predicted O-methyltransferase YrrM
MPDVQSKVQTIRPRVIFGEIEKRFNSENVIFQSIMPPTQIGSMTLLEGAVLASLVKLVNAKHIFEFGTFMGSTSVLFALNSSDDCHVTTLDIDPEELAQLNTSSDGSPDSELVDDFLRERRSSEGAPSIQRAPIEVQQKITQLIQNSKTLDVEKQDLSNKFDLVFVDGGHDYETARSDTFKAIDMVKPHGVVAWHDYGSDVFSDVTKLVNELSHDMPIFHVEPSMIAFHAPALTKKMNLD